MEIIKASVFFSIFATSYVNSIGMGYPGNTDSMIYLGTAGRKSFYSVPLPLITWVEAKGVCHDAHMELATITTPEESILLRSVANNETFKGQHYWSAGRDAHKHSQFVWDLNEEIVNTTGVPKMYVYPDLEFQTCLVYKIVLTADPVYDEFQPRLCSTRAGGALCMVLH